MKRRKGTFLLCGALIAGVSAPAYAQTVSFTDVSESAGLRTSGVGHGAAVHDYDGDGWDDVFITTLSGSSRLFRNKGDATFEDVTADAGLQETGAYTVALWGDVDNDGWADLFLGRAASGKSRLFRNTGDGHFEDISDQAGLDEEAPIATAAFGDVDGDGAVDLFLAVHGREDHLYRNTSGAQDAVFEDVSSSADIGGPTHSVPMQATWIDYDRDFDLDLYCVHDGRVESRLYDNGDFWPLRDVAFASGMHRYPDPFVCCNMGTAWGDFDGDGWMDAYVTRIGKGGLFRNNGNGTFTDEAEARGAARNGMSWGVVWLDAENDGDIDLFVVSTSGYDGTPTLLFENDGGSFTEIGQDAGASFRIDARGLATGDFNGDGRPDLVIVSTDGRNRLLLNDSATAGRWVKLDLRGRAFNAMAIGTRIEIVAAGKTHVRTVSGGDSYASQSSSTIHVGLGTAPQIDTLRILWSAGNVQEMTDLEVDMTYRIDEGIPTQVVPPNVGTPVSFSFHDMYPNPARDEIHVAFNLQREGAVRIEIHDVVGRNTISAAEERLPPGRYERIVDIGGLSSGLYLVRLVSDRHMVVRGVVVSR